MSTIEIIGSAVDYLSAVAGHWESLELDTTAITELSSQVETAYGTTRWGQTGNYIILGTLDGYGNPLTDVVVPEDELFLWQVPLTSPDTIEHEATRGTLTLPVINNAAIVSAKTPKVQIGQYVKPVVPEEAPDAPLPPEWVQPLGAHDAYDLGALTIHEGSTWISLVLANVWEPGVTSWREVVEEGELPQWAQPTGAHDAYALGAQVQHNGHAWTSNTAANVWEPGVFGWDDNGEL